MPLDPHYIRTLLPGDILVRGVDQVPRGHVRIETGLLYPDGTSVEVFVKQDTPLLQELVLTDLGQTMQWLMDVQVKPWLSKKRQAFLEDVLRLYDVKRNGAALETPLRDMNDLAGAVLRLAQACVRVADLTFTRRTALQASFAEDLQEILVDAEVPYEENAEIPGRYGNLVRVDFLAQGRTRRAALMGLSSANRSSAHTLALEVFRRWYDLETVPVDRLTILDDRYDTYRDEDLARLEELSVVLRYSEPNGIARAVAA